MDKSAAINRIINFFDVMGQLPVEFRHPGGGGGGNNDLEIGQPCLDRADQLGGDIDLAHTDRVDPENVTVGNGLLDLRAIPPKTLGKSALPVPPSPHF